MLELQSLPHGRGTRWPMGTSTGTARHYFEGWCHGAAGYVQLWTCASRVLGVPRYLALAERAAWTAWEAPPGDASLCCGYAGRAYALLRMFIHSGAQAWLMRAVELRDRAIKISRHQPQLNYSLLKGRLGLELLSRDLLDPHSAAFPFIERNLRAASLGAATLRHLPSPDRHAIA